jgi:hypothetical protein
MVPRLKISSISPKENTSSTYLISITSLPEDKQTSKHGGGGRYNAIWSSRGANKKMMKEKKKKMSIKKRKKEIKKNTYEKRNIYIYIYMSL